MAIETCTDAVHILPSAAGGVSVTPSGTAWAYSAYVQVTAAMPAAGALVGIVAASAYGSFVHYEVEVGVGAAGAEVVVARCRGVFGPNGTNSLFTDAGEQGWMPALIPVASLANGARVAVRMRKGGINTTPWEIALGYLNTPLAGTLSTTTAIMSCLPAGADGIAVTPSGTSWVSGAWAQLTASMPADSVLAGLAYWWPTSVADAEVDIGTGGAGAEAVVTTLPISPTNSGLMWPGLLMLKLPLDILPTATRIAARLRIGSTSVTPMALALIYYPKPL